MKKRISFLMLFFVGLLMYGQSAGIQASTAAGSFNSVTSNNAGVWIKNIVDTKIEGSVYLFPNWNTICVLSTDDGKLLRMTDMNYDAKHDKIVARISQDSLYEFNPKGIKEVRISNRLFRRYLDPEFNRNSFYEVMGEGNEVKILKRNNIAIKEGSFNPLTQKKQSSDKYIIKETYFYKKNDKVIPLKLSKKSVLSLLDNEKGEVKEFIKKNSLSVKNTKDLNRIVIFSNSI